MVFYHKSLKRFYEQDLVYFVVTKTYKNFPYFKEPIFCDLFIEELKLCKKLKKFRLYGFCLVYDHLNLLIQPNDEFNISKVIQSIKKEFSRDVNYIIVGDIPECRLQGKQYSKQYYNDFAVPNLNEFYNRFTQKYSQHQPQIPKFKWQKSFYDHVIRNEKEFEIYYNYTVHNFLKHGLPEDWKYTSLNYDYLIDRIDL